MSRKRLVIANWKLYIHSKLDASTFIKKLRSKSRLFSGVEVMIAPQSPLVQVVAEKLKGSNISAAAQTVSQFDSGAHTGEVSISALKDLGARAIIVGHSERRAMGESNDSVATKLSKTVEQGMMAILCIGESERDQAGEHFSFLEEQLQSALKTFPKSAANKLVIAYEPVWAIGKSAQDAMKASDLTETVIFIRKILVDVLGRAPERRVTIIYGGSVEAANARELMSETGIGGFLVGHASATVDSFLEILKSCK